MTRKERCPECFKTIVGLFQIKQVNHKRQWIRKAYYCNNCNLVLKDNEVCYEHIIYKLKSEL